VPFLARRMWIVAVSRSICCRRMSTSSLTRNASRKAKRTSNRSRVGLRLLPAVSISVAISPLSDTRAAGNRRSWPSGRRVVASVPPSPSAAAPLSNFNSVRPLISVGRRPHLIEEQAFGWGRRGAPLGGPKQSAKQPPRHFLVDSSPLQGPLAGVCHARHELGLTCLLGARLLPIWSPAAIHY
jgi:hypothetical protein